ncbi:MAG: methyltransferase domain-containing protein [Planctomycetes bacterium]|nr:methyltransferase domain-containing protein [Planctomycetota bacterium]
MSAEPYARAPLGLRDGIPVFSTPSAYTENYEQIAHDHLAHARVTGENPWIPEDLWVETEQETLALIRRHAGPAGRVLDVGVGTGRLLGRLPEWRRYGMDISFEYLAAARAQGIEVCWSLVEDMPYAAASFDLVTCTDVLEHVLDLHRACERILAVLKPGGTLVVRVPYREDLEPYLDPALPYRFVHLRSFDTPALRLLFEKVFGCRWLDASAATPNPTRPRLPLRVRGYGRALAAATAAARRLGPRAARAVRAALFVPYALNVVFAAPPDPGNEKRPRE